MNRTGKRIMGFGQFFHSPFFKKIMKRRTQSTISEPSFLIFSENRRDNRLGFGAISETRTTLD
jgi:hypothetical protein